jgi:autotransporter-associated beta strand protein
LIHGTPFGVDADPSRRCPINHTFLLCWDKFNIEPVPCGSDFANLDVDVCWAQESTDAETLNFSACDGLTVWLGYSPYNCTTTLVYSGDAKTTNATIEMLGDGVIEANGGALVLTTAIVHQQSGNRTLTLSGSSVEANTMAAAISNPSGGVLSLHKTGTGLWRLSAASGYSGGLEVLDGTLVVAANVGETGASPFGTQTVSLPVIGNSAAGGSGTAALLLANGVEISRGFSVDGPAGSPQIVVIGGEGAGDSVVTFQADITLGRSVTLQAATGGTITFSNSWSGGGGSVGVTIGSAGNGGTVALEQALPVTLSGVNVVNGRAELYGTDLIAPATPVTVGSSLGSAVLNLNSAYEEVSQTLSDLSFAGNSGSITGGTLRLTGTISAGGSGHEISSAVALDATATFSGAGTLLISGVVSGASGFVKNGSGTVRLSAANDYTGNTTINAGTMLAESLTAFGTGAIVVNTGGTLDKGGFALANAITNNGGTVIN